MKFKVGDLVRFKATRGGGDFAIVVGILDRDDPAVEALVVVCADGARHRTWDYLVEKVCNE